MTADTPTIDAGLDDDCASCGEGMPRDECPQSKRPCGHHCNHSWTHDGCDWCGKEFGEEPTDTPAIPAEVLDAAVAIGRKLSRIEMPLQHFPWVSRLVDNAIEAALTAALPGVVAAAKAEGWDEGYMFTGAGQPAFGENPYRATE